MNEFVTRHIATWNATDVETREEVLATHWSPPIGLKAACASTR